MERGTNTGNTRDYIPRKLKTAAYDLWGRGQCILCGSKTHIDLHHCYHSGHGREKSPYLHTKPWELVPLCRACHRKVHTIHGGILKKVLRFLVRKKGKLVKKKLEAFLEEKIEEGGRRIPFGQEEEWVRKYLRLPKDLRLKRFVGGSE